MSNLFHASSEFAAIRGHSVMELFLQVLSVVLAGALGVAIAIGVLYALALIWLDSESDE